MTFSFRIMTFFLRRILPLTGTSRFSSKELLLRVLQKELLIRSSTTVLGALRRSDFIEIGRNLNEAKRQDVPHLPR